MSHDHLIVRLPNWVGDVVMALPTLHAFTQNGIKLQLFGKPWSLDLLSGTDMQLSTLKKHSLATTREIMQKANTNKALVLTNSFSSALMMRLAAKKVIGYRSDWRNFLLEASLEKRQDIHEVEYFWEIARFACQHWFPSISWPAKLPTKINLPLSQHAVKKVSQMLLQANITKPFLVLCPFAHGTAKDGTSKIWPYWHELVQQLKGYQLIVCPGNQQEQQQCRQQPLSNTTVLSQLNLAEYAALMAEAECVIANDSGPMHMAAAVAKKSLGIFGATNPARTHPWGGEYMGEKGQFPSANDVLSRLQTLFIHP